MTEKEFRRRFSVRMCAKCCATCKYGRDLCDDGAYDCVHPHLDGDNMVTSAEDVCDAWERPIP